MKLITLAAAALLLSPIAFSQNGPGGIKSDVETHIWLDAGEMISASEGSLVSLWPDQSGNGNNFLQPYTNRRPIYHESGANSKPYVEFINDWMDSPSIANFNTNQKTWLYVGEFNGTPTSYQVVINSDYSPEGNDYMTYYNNIYNTLFDVSYDPGYKANGIPFNSSLNMHMAIRDVNTLSTYSDGALMTSRSDLVNTPAGHNHVRIGGRAGLNATYLFTGNLYEVIAMDASLNSAEINILTNYLAAKYDFTPSLDLYDYQASFGENVIGIGQEADGSNTSATGKGIINLSGADAMINGEYFLLGDDNISLANTSTDVPASEPAQTKRFERVWRVGENQGDVGNVTITLDISTYRPGTNPSTIKICVSSDGDFSSTGVATAGTYNSGNETMTYTMNLSDGDYVSFCGSEGDIESTGVTSNWSLTTTWDCACLPSLSDSVTILNGHTVNVDAAGANARTIVVQGTGTLDFTGGDLTVEENIISTGSFNATSGTLTFDGPSSGQTLSISGTANIDNFTVSNSNGATLTGGTFVINGTFTMTGNIDNSGATDFIINSTAAGDGRINSVPGSIGFSNDIKIRRYIPAGNAGYRNLSPNTFSFTLEQWDDELVISGDGYPDGCALQGGSCFYSFKEWDGSAFVDVPAVNNTHTVGTGFHAFIGDDLSTFSGATLESSGSIQSGTFSQVGYTNWNFLGNPYPSAIDFSSLQTVSYRMDDYYYVYDPATAAYDWYDGTGGTGNLDQYISMGQAFWAAPPVGATQPLQANYNELVKTGQTATWKSLNNSPAMYLSLSSARDNYGNKIAFNTHEDALIGLDTIDIPHLVTPNESAPYIATTNEYNESITVSYFPSDEVTITQPIFVNTPFMDYYTITAENLNLFNQYSCVYLLDLKTNERINLREEPSYTFFVDQMKSDETRFLLVCSNNGQCDIDQEGVLSTTTLNSESDDVSIQQMNNFFNVNFDFNKGESSSIVVLNTLGQIVYDSGNFNISKGTKSLNLDQHHSGVHIIKVTHGNVTKTEKVYIQ